MEAIVRYDTRGKFNFFFSFIILNKFVSLESFIKFYKKKKFTKKYSKFYPTVNEKKEKQKLVLTSSSIIKTNSINR